MTNAINGNSLQGPLQARLEEKKPLLNPTSQVAKNLLTASISDPQRTSQFTDGILPSSSTTLQAVSGLAYTPQAVYGLVNMPQNVSLFKFESPNELKPSSLKPDEFRQLNEVLLPLVDEVRKVCTNIQEQMNKQHGAKARVVIIVNIFFHSKNLILQCFDNPAAVDLNGLNALHRAARDGQIDILRSLLTSHPHLLNTRSNDGKTALHWSVHARSPDAYCRLLRAGADRSAKDNVGYTVLHLAVLVGSVALVQLLLNTQRELLDFPDNDGNTPLLLTAWRTELDVFNMLVKAGARLDATNKKGRTALHLAILSKHLSLAQHLITLRKEFLDIKDSDGCTPLMIPGKIGTVRTDDSKRA